MSSGHTKLEEEEEEEENAQSRKFRERLERIQKFVLKNFLPLGFSTALILGLSIPVVGKTIGDVKVGGWSVASSLCVCVIFVISGLTLSTSDIKEAMSAWPAALLGLLSILVITPLFGAVPLRIPFEPPEFQYGLAIFCMMPTTLSSGVALVTQAKGNAALALILTVGSNLLGILTIPFVVSALLNVSDVSIDPLPLLMKLCATILVPLVIGKSIRESSEAIQGFVKTHKVKLGLLNNGCLIIVAWMKLSQSADKFKEIALYNILLAVLAGIAIHCVFLLLNFSILALPCTKLANKEYKAVMIMASQKTLPVAVTVIGFLPAGLGEQGLMVIPCIISHMSQIFIDAAIVSRWAQQWEQEERDRDQAEELQEVDELVLGDGDETDTEDSGLEVDTFAPAGRGSKAVTTSDLNGPGVTSNLESKTAK